MSITKICKTVKYSSGQVKEYFECYEHPENKQTLRMDFMNHTTKIQKKEGSRKLREWEKEWKMDLLLPKRGNKIRGHI